MVALSLKGCDSDGDSEPICDATPCFASRCGTSGDSRPTVVGIVRFASHDSVLLRSTLTISGDLSSSTLGPTIQNYIGLPRTSDTVPPNCKELGNQRWSFVTAVPPFSMTYPESYRRQTETLTDTVASLSVASSDQVSPSVWEFWNQALAPTPLLTKSEYQKALTFLGQETGLPYSLLRTLGHFPTT